MQKRGVVLKLGKEKGRSPICDQAVYSDDHCMSVRKNSLPQRHQLKGKGNARKEKVQMKEKRGESASTIRSHKHKSCAVT